MEPKRFTTTRPDWVDSGMSAVNAWIGNHLAVSDDAVQIGHDPGIKRLSAFRFDSAYREEVTLADGTRIVLRLLRPEDKALLAEGLARLSPETQFRRFHGAKRRFSAAELRYLTDIDGVRHFAIGAVIEGPDGRETGLGIARFVQLPGKDHVAEPAVVVVDEFQGRGVGGLLLQRLVEAARERGVQRFSAVVQGDNRPLLTLLQAHAPEANVRVEGGVVAVEMPLPSANRPASADDVDKAETPGLLARLLALAAEGVFVLVSGAAALLGTHDQAARTGEEPAETRPREPGEPT